MRVIIASASAICTFVCEVPTSCKNSTSAIFATSAAASDSATTLGAMVLPPSSSTAAAAAPPGGDSATITMGGGGYSTVEASETSSSACDIYLAHEILFYNVACAAIGLETCKPAHARFLPRSVGKLARGARVLVHRTLVRVALPRSRRCGSVATRRFQRPAQMRIHFR